LAKIIDKCKVPRSLLAHGVSLVESLRLYILYIWLFGDHWVEYLH